MLVLLLLSGSVSASEPVRVRYTIEYPATMKDDEYFALESRVANRPEHPERRTYESETRRRASGPDRVEHEAWVSDRGVVRINTSNTADALYYDVAENKDVVWMMSSVQLTLANANGSNAAGSPEIRTSLGDAETLIGYLLSSGASIRDSLPLGPWEEGPDGYVARADGLELVRQTGSEGAVEVRLAMADMAPQEVGRRWVLTGVRRTALAQEPHPTRFEEYSPDGVLERRVILGEVERVTDSILREVTRQPPIKGEDPIRGPTTFVAVMDHRKAESTITVADEDGGLRTIPLSETPEAIAYRRLRAIGWVTATVLIGGLVYLRIRSNKT